MHCLTSLCCSLVLMLGACTRGPDFPIVAPRGSREGLSLQRAFRLVTLDFGRTSGDARDLGNAIPAMLLTELQKGGRFAILDGGSLRADGQIAELIHEGNASQYADGYLTGTITAITSDNVCLDLRISNSITHEVLYGRSLCLDFAMNGQVDHAATKRLAEEIERAVRQVSYGRVISVSGQRIICDKGSKAGVTRGMVAYLVGTGDGITDASLHKMVELYTQIDPSDLVTLATPIIVGEMHIIAVEDNHSIGKLYNGGEVLPGDTVFFK